MESKLYVGNLPYSTTGDDLRTLFSQAGKVVSADVIMDRMSGQSKGFAFVQMETPAEAEKAISMFNGYKMGNRELKVNLARPKEDTGRGFGGPRGGSGGGFNRGGNRDRNGGPRRF